MAAAQSRCSVQTEELSRLEKIVGQLQKRDEQARDDLEVLKSRDAKLTSFIKEKEDKTKQRETLRFQRNRIYSLKKDVEDKIIAAKRSIDRSYRLKAESEKAMEELQQKKAHNDKRDVEVILPARTELEDIIVEKKAAEAILAKTDMPIKGRAFDDEKTKLTQLCAKHESMRKDVEMKRARVQALKLEVEEEGRQLKAEMESLEKGGLRTAKILEEEQKRLVRVKARRDSRNEALRKLQVLRFGSAVIYESKQVERNLAVQQLP